MQGRMRVVLILSLAVVLLVSESFAAPSLVDAPEVAETPQADEEKVSSDDKEDLQLQLAGKSDDDDEPEINHKEVAKEFGLTETDLEELYQTWVPTVPAGEDSTFQAYLDWMDANDEPEDEGAVGPGTHYLRSIIKWTGKIRNKANKKAKGQRSIDEEQPQMDRSQIAAEFGLNETDLEELYKLWVTKVPAGVDSSFPEFLIWMEENDEPDDEGAVGPGTHGAVTTTIKWVFRIVNGIRKGYKEFVENNKPKRPRSIEGEEALMDSNEIAAGTRKRQIMGHPFPIPQWTPGNGGGGNGDRNRPNRGKDRGWNRHRGFFRRQRELEEDQQQSIVNGQVSIAARDLLQPSFKAGPDSAKFGLTEAELEELYEMWVTKVPAGEDSSFQAFLNIMAENDELETEGAIGPAEKRRLRDRPLRLRRPRPRELNEDQQQSIANGEESMAVRDLQRSVDDEQSEIDQEEIATPDLKRLRRGRKRRKSGRRRSGLTHFPITTFWIPRRRSLSELDEDQQQSIVNGQESMAARDLQPSFKPGPKSPSSEEVELPKENAEDETLGVGAAEFGLTEAELKDLYELWATKVPAGEDSSFQAFFQWMDENDEPEDEGAIGPETHFRKVIKWTRRVVKWIEKNTKRGYIADEQQIAEVQRSIDEEEPQINQQEIATPDKRNFAAWWKKFGKMFQRKKPRALEEDQQQSIVNGNGDAEMPKENVGDESLGVNAAAYSGQNLFDAYRKWLKTVGEGKDRTFQKFADLFNIRKPRSLESELSDESKLPDKEMPKGEEKEKEVPAEESKPNDTNGGYSCEKNSPCNIENIVNEQFYFATTSNDKFIQCDAWGGCHTLICDDGLVWDDQIKTCGLRT